MSAPIRIDLMAIWKLCHPTFRDWFFLAGLPLKAILFRTPIHRSIPFSLAAGLSIHSTATFFRGVLPSALFVWAIIDELLFRGSILRSAEPVTWISLFLTVALIGSAGEALLLTLLLRSRPRRAFLWL